jgi:hypothetical protein
MQTTTAAAAMPPIAPVEILDFDVDVDPDAGDEPDVDADPV